MIKSTLLKLLILPLMAFQLQAEEVATYEVGQRIAPFKATDQHGKAYQFKTGTSYLLISFDMSTGKKANKALHAKGATYLPGKRAVFVANIYGMPKIGRAFALPKMRKYVHSIILADADGLLDRYPTEKGKVTLLKLDKNGSITSINYWDPKSQEIDALLK